MEADECQIDPTGFEAFVDALLTRHRSTRHAVVIALSEGFVATVLVLAARAGIEVAWNSSDGATGDEPTDVQVPAPLAPNQEAWASALRQKSRELDRFMAC